MHTIRKGGLTEFIPSPKEKRTALINDHVLNLLANIDQRVKEIEGFLKLPQDQAEAFALKLKFIQEEERASMALNRKMKNGES